MAQGRLPGQLENQALFARAPKTLMIEDLRNPPDPCNAGCDWGWTTSDIFFWEVCFFNQVCKNKDDLFSVDVGEVFKCEFDRAKFFELRKLLA